MRVLLVLAMLLVVGVVDAGIVHGEADDSPGLQGIGVLLVVGTVVLTVRRVRRGATPHRH